MNFKQKKQVAQHAELNFEMQSMIFLYELRICLMNQFHLNSSGFFFFQEEGKLLQSVVWSSSVVFESNAWGTEQT